MADPPSFFVTSLAGQNIPIVPDAFFTGKNEFMKLKLTSDTFDKTWEVKLNGRRFAGGWEDFSADHCLLNDDVLVFRHDGDMVFHVTPSGRSFSLKKQQCVSSCGEDGDDDNNDDDDDDDDDDGDSKEDNDDDVVDKEEEDETWEDDSDSMNKKKSILEADSLTSSKNSCLLAVSPFSLRKNIVNLSKPFSRSNCLDKKCCEIDLMNQSGKSWVFGLRHNKSSGQVYMIRGWRSFCRANELKLGFSYRFKLVRNGTKPLLQLCSDIAPERNCSNKGNNKFLTITLKAYMFESGQIRLPRPFTRENGIKKAGQITLVDENGVKWPSYLTSAREQSQVYMTRGWIDFCEASKLMIGETFTLKFVRGEDTTPMLEFYSKDKMEQATFDGSQGTVQASRDGDETETRVQKRARVSTGGPSRCTRASNKWSVDPKTLQCKKPLQTCSQDEEEDGQEETETQVQKRARVSTEGGPSRCTLASNKSSVDQKNLQRKQSLQPCSVSDQFANVKQSIVDILTGVRRFRSELEIKEQNLEASLLEIDALGEKC